MTVFQIAGLLKGHSFLDYFGERNQIRNWAIIFQLPLIQICFFSDGFNTFSFNHKLAILRMTGTKTQRFVDRGQAGRGSRSQAFFAIG